MLNNWHIRRACRVIAGGGIIAYPTEAVYGLGCNPFDIHAVARILTLKRRRPDRGLIVVAASIEQLEPVIRFTGEVRMDSVISSWPGPVTWVLPARKEVPVWLRGIQGGLAVRVSSHPVVRELCLKAGVLVSTSANPEGLVPARSPGRVRAYFNNNLDYILYGPTGGAGAPTEIRDARSGELLRPGASTGPGNS